MRLDDILKRLLELHPNKLIDLKLDRIERILADMGAPHKNLPPIIHVAGTNGKGSTIAFLRAILEAAGNKVHVYSSPHLVSFRERIRLAGKLVSAKRLNKALSYCEKINNGEPITYFEITTACAFYLFSQIRADYLLLEVGLGGRFDATNVIDKPLGTIITPISLDHKEFLGDNLSQIAYEKAGIIKKNSPLIVGAQQEEALSTIKEQADKLGVVPFCRGEDYDVYEQNGRLIYQDNNGLLDLPTPNLAGEFQFENAALAIGAIRHFNLPITEEQIAKGLVSANWPGRLMVINSGELFDILPKSSQLWLDGGHNIAGAKILAREFAENRKAQNQIMIVGSYANKDIKGFLRQFIGIMDRIITVPIKGDRACYDAKDLAQIAKNLGLKAKDKPSLRAALKEVAKYENSKILICGSLHLVGEFLAKNKTIPD